MNYSDKWGKNMTKAKEKEKDKLQRKIKKRRSVVKFLLFIICISTVIVLLYKSEVFNIKAVVVKNNNYVSSDEVTVLSEVINKNIFLIKKGVVEDNVKKNPYVEAIKYKRKLPSTLIISLTEKKIRGLIKFQSSFINVDSKGKMVQVINKFPSGEIPLIEGVKVEKYEAGLDLVNGDLLKQKTLEEMLLISDYKEFKGQIYSINIDNPYDIILKTTGGMTIKIGSSNDLGNKLTYAYNVLNSKEVKGKKGTLEVVELQSEYNVIFKEN